MESWSWRRCGAPRLEALLGLLLLLEAAGAATQDGGLVRVGQGLLRTTLRRMRNSDGQMVACAGIPYGAPPVGERRFKDAEAAGAWEGERGCGEECAECAQPLNPAGGSFSKGAEDCLCLNVFAPHPLPEGAAVMVWIHGGAFVAGDGGDLIYGPDFLVRQGVVIVTLNYRLGALGFLDLGTEDAPGNQGLKDQVLALKWVRQNIAAFGGDPERVTIFGESAGSASVHYHTLSPMSKGLFAGAILQSGSALNGWAFKSDARPNVRRLLQAAKCAPALADDPPAAVRCLRQAPPARLVAPTGALKSEEDVREGALIAFPPTLDGAFLPREPCAQVANASAAAVRTLAGFNSAEGILSVALVRFRGGMEAWDRGLDAGRGLCLPCEPCAAADAAAHAQWGAAVRRRFLRGQPLSDDTLQGYVDFSTFTCFFRGIFRAALARAAASPLPHFFYEFDVESPLNFAKALFGGQDLNGSSHADELAYLFHNKLSEPPGADDSVASVTRRRLLALWTDFAKTGNPTPQTSDLLPVKWQPLSANGQQYYYIGTDGVEMRAHPLKQDAEFFEGLWKGAT